MKHIIIILISILPFSTFAQQDSVVANAEQKEITLSDAIKTALERNYKVKISKKNLEIAEINNSWGRAGRYPVVTASVTNGNRYDNGEPTTGTDGRTETSSISLSPAITANWILFNGFNVRYTKKNLEEYRNISDDNLKLQLENTIYQTILGYYDILLQKEKLNTVTEIMVLSKDRYEYVKVRKELGSAVTFDVLQVKDAFLSDSSNYILQKLNLDNSIRNFNKLLADTVYISYTPTDTFDTELIDLNYKELKDKMLENNKTLNIQNINQKILKNNISIQRSSLYPSLSLNAGINNNNLRNKMINPDAGTMNSQTYGTYANLTLSYTIFNGWNRKKNIQNSIIEEEIGQMNIEDLKLSLNNQLLSMIELFNARKQLYKVADENVKSAKLNLEIAKDKFSSGAINSFNYRDIQLSYINASFKKLEAIYLLIGSKNDLLKLTGKIISKY